MEQFKVIEGHLTQGNKAAIRAIFAAGLTAGKVGRTNYATRETDGIFEVQIKLMETRTIGDIPRLTMHRVKFTLGNSKPQEQPQTAKEPTTLTGIFKKMEQLGFALEVTVPNMQPTASLSDILTIIRQLKAESNPANVELIAFYEQKVRDTMQSFCAKYSM